MYAVSPLPSGTKLVYRSMPNATVCSAKPAMATFAASRLQRVGTHGGVWVGGAAKSTTGPVPALVREASNAASTSTVPDDPANPVPPDEQLAADHPECAEPLVDTVTGSDDLLIQPTVLLQREH